MSPILQRPDSGVYPISFFKENVFAAFSGREYPKSRFPQFLQAAGLDPNALARPKQVHGDEILVLSSSGLTGGSIEMDPRFRRDDARPEADAIITNLPGPVLGILTADCIPAFFWDPVSRSAGLAHAGWRGLKADILEKTLRNLNENYGARPENMRVVFGPFIRACCYEVGREFAEYFPRFYQPRSAEKGHLDLAAAARERIFAAAILPDHFEDTGLCTSCRRDAFFSARCGDQEERILSVIHIQ